LLQLYFVTSEAPESAPSPSILSTLTHRRRRSRSFAFLYSIANQILIPLGYFLGAINPHTGAAMTARDMVANNFVWSTLGNFTGGACFVGVPYFLLYGRYSALLNRISKF
jgi:hypothetical protein